MTEERAKQLIEEAAVFVQKRQEEAVAAQEEAQGEEAVGPQITQDGEKKEENISSDE